jgi:hypothetical protein
MGFSFEITFYILPILNKAVIPARTTAREGGSAASK